MKQLYGVSLKLFQYVFGHTILIHCELSTRGEGDALNQKLIISGGNYDLHLEVTEETGCGNLPPAPNTHQAGL